MKAIMSIRSRLITMALCAATLTSACSEEDREVADDCQPAGLVIVTPFDAPLDGITLREQGPPEASYVETWDGAKIHGKQFAEAVLSCVDIEDPGWLLTLSSYAPDVTHDQRVLGIGGSAYVTGDLADCFAKHWAVNGAIEL